MKRTLPFVLVLALLLSLVACGSTPRAEQTPEPPAVSELPTVQETPEEAEKTEETAAPPAPAAPEKPAHKEWKTMNVLMIGNSFCYYYVQELYAMAYMAGYKLNLCNLYEAGCYVEEHWTWLNDDSPNYDFWITDSAGRWKHQTIKTFKEAVAYADWDVISLQQHFAPFITGSTADALKTCTPYVKDLYAYLKTNCPDAELYWHETWAYEVGHRSMPDAATQTKQQISILEASAFLSEENGVALIPSGHAWTLARADDAVGDTLCLDDNLHDGESEGGQYLNACVWFEVLFRQSCVGNGWRPVYFLKEQKLLALQQHAHDAVAAVYGEDYAK